VYCILSLRLPSTAMKVFEWVDDSQPRVS
jgi:hypothetical protein